MNLVAIPFHDWKKCEHEGFRTRDAHFMQEFSKHPQITKLLIINRPISWAEMILLRRNRYPQNGKLIYQKENSYLCQINAQTYTIDTVIPQLIRPLWMRRKWTPYIFGHPQVRQSIQQAIAYLNMLPDYNMFLSAPLFVPLVQSLSPTAWTLDAQDNLLKQPFYQNTPNLRDFYDYCLQNADVLFANSLETTRWFAQTRPDAIWVANGVDTTIFTPQEYPRPMDMRSITSPIVGYAGKMQEMVDVIALEQAFQEFPDVNFVFIGQQLNPKWVKSLWQYPNAYYLGDKPYSILPQYLASFDICMIPYNIERQHGGDPIKFYEYLAMGKPIVTADIGGVHKFVDYPQVYISQNSAQFVQGIQKMVRAVKNNQQPAIRPIPDEHSWQTKANQIIIKLNQLALAKTKT